MTISLSIFRLALLLVVAGTASGALAASNNGYDKTPGGLPGEAPLPRGDRAPVRPEIAKPLQEAQNANQQQNWSLARAKLDEADAVHDKTPIEIFYIDVTRATALKGAGDPAGAAKVLAAALDTGKAKPEDAPAIMANIANLYAAAKDYPDTVAWAQKYAQAGGKDPGVAALVVQAEYLSGDYAGAARDAQKALDAATQAHQKPSEELLLLIGNCYLKQNNDTAYTGLLEQLVGFYPTQQYWADLIAHVGRRPGFPDRLMLPLNRLQHATGALTTKELYTDMVELDLQEGISSEAKAIADEGAAKGLVAKPLQAKATAAAEADRKKLDRDEKEAAALKDGNLLVSVGYTYVGFTDYQKGIAALEQGIAKGGLKHPDDAKLALGIAYFQAGQSEKALAAFKSVTDPGSAGDVARLWALRVQQGA